MSSLEVTQRLAALVPRPRLRLIRIHGVLAPSVINDTKLRATVVPRGDDEVALRGHALRETRGGAHRRGSFARGRRCDVRASAARDKPGPVVVQSKAVAANVRHPALPVGP